MTTEMIEAKGNPKKAYEAFVGKTLEQLSTAVFLSPYKDDAHYFNPFFRSKILGALAEPVAYLASLTDEQLAKMPRVGPKAILLLDSVLPELETMEFPVVLKKDR